MNKPSGTLVSLAGRTALVAGSSGGIGAAVAHMLSESGAHVIGADIAPRPRGATWSTIACDCATSEGVAHLYERLANEHALPDIVVHCVGITRDKVLWKLDDEDWSAVLHTNLDSAFRLLRAAIPPMRERGHGSIVLVSSINGERGKRGQANYAASKAGLIGLARTAAREVGRFGIRVNVVSPGLVRTAMSAELAPEILQTAISESPLGRTAEPEDVAGAVLFLASDLARHVTGQVLRVDGGQLIG
jgi:acetoacetyl-CoA reductase/3-oxoacyl-[acyl-carrier protein] reductase